MTSLMRDNRGYSLMELLVSVVLISIVLGLSARALTDSMRAEDAIVLLADANQNLQSSSTMMVRDFVDAGRNVKIGGLPLPDGPGADVVRPGPPNVVAAPWPTATTLYGVTPWNELGPTISSNVTDAVTIVSVDDRVDIPSSSIVVDNNGATLTLTAGGVYNTNSANTLRVGDLLWVMRSGVSAVLYITAISGANSRTITAATAGDPSNFNQQNATTGSMAQVGTSPTPAPPAAQVPDLDTAVKRIKMITYWVEEQGGMPYLMRQENYQAAVQVGLGVDNLELAYDVIANGAVTRVNNPFTDITPAASPNQFDKAHIALAVRSDRRFAQTKGYLRNDLTTQVSLRSLQVQQNFM